MREATLDFSVTPFEAKFAGAESARVHTMLVIGPRYVEAGNVAVRLHGNGNVGAKLKSEVVVDILAATQEGRASLRQSGKRFGWQ
jgi:threonyl-tRNA synthetase